MTNKIIKVVRRDGQVINEISVMSNYAAKKQAQRMIDKYGEAYRIFIEQGVEQQE